MGNLTITIDEESLKKARILAPFKKELQLTHCSGIF